MLNDQDSIRAYIERQIIRVPIAGCWLWTGCVDNAQYPVTGVVHSPERKIYRLAWHCYNGPIPIGKHVLHKCDVTLCVNPNHLFLGSHTDNMLDRNRKGRNARFSGERHGSAKLTMQQAKAIKYSRLPARKIADQFHVSRWAVYDLRSGRTWPHI